MSDNCNQSNKDFNDPNQSEEKSKSRKSKEDDVVIQPNLIDLSEVEIKPIEWFWFNKIPFGDLTLVVGLPKQGKSMMTVYMASVASQGLNWCDGSPCEMGSILIFAGEDRPEEYARRLKANGADLTKIRILDNVTITNLHTGESEEKGITLKDLAAIDAAIQSVE